MMRHSRSHQFQAAVDNVDQLSSAQRWSDVADDPNDANAIVYRAETLRRAWRRPVAEREAFLVERCAGRRVLDIGCVAHDVSRMKSEHWLHRRLSAAAARCVGVDILHDGVEQMKQLGFVAYEHDLSGGLGPLADEAPFDVIVAGELIEHVGSIDMLFEVATDALSPDGELIITTPNPWAPDRVRAGQLGHAWENVDHISFAFPSGIAELADRHGLVLAEALTTTRSSARPSAVQALKAIKRRIKGTHWVTVGIATFDDQREVRVGAAWPRLLAQRLLQPRRRFIGETFIYVVRRRSTVAE